MRLFTSTPARLEFRRSPSALAFMVRALHPSAALPTGGGDPAISARWLGHRIDRRHLIHFSRLTGLRSDEGVPILYPHVAGFRLQMVVLTHPAFPIPIWRGLQIRNHILQHRMLSALSLVDLETHVGGHRVLEKGVEIDLCTTVTSRAEVLWESVNTFYYRGRFGPAGPAGPASPRARAPDIGGGTVARWRTPSGGGWSLGRLTGDYNGVHWWSRYARKFGFRRAFHHPQFVLAQCLARLPAPDPGRRQRLDAWLKGPVYYASEVRLQAAVSPGSTSFALIPDYDERPALLGQWRAAESEDRLIA